MADYIYLVQMDIPAEFEDDFNRIYDEEHVPNILTVKGVHSCARYKLESSDREGVARYVAIYEIDSPDLPRSAEWIAQSDKGDWPAKIRPHTTNRTRSVLRRIS
ncbi:MAG: hypothetical protein L0177_18220 [Chloroflexi bacterium]|nr:hypothetical protein [Chloroflexota bacterium]